MGGFERKIDLPNTKDTKPAQISLPPKNSPTSKALSHRAQDILVRFWGKVDTAAPGGCWEWTASRDGRGNGQLMWFHPDGTRRPIRAHRFAWAISRCGLDENHFLRNSCGRKHCVNPEHWQLSPEHKHTAVGRARLTQFANERSTVTTAARTPTTRELEWIAGFMEGEGNFRCHNTPQARASQVNPEPINRLVALLGGTVSYHTQRQKQHHPFFTWQTSGARARGIMMTLYPLMSAKRQEQIRTALRKLP